jgi:hypothetical protein
MSAFVGIVRAGGLAPHDVDRLTRAAAALGLTSAARSPRPGVSVIGDAPLDGSPDADGWPSLRRAADGSASYVANDSMAGVVAFASDARVALAAAGRAVRLDNAGFSGLLWRGAPLDARFPLAGVVVVPADGQIVLDPHRLQVARSAQTPVESQPTSEDDVRRAIEALVSAPGFAVLTRAGHASLALLAVRRLAGAGDADAFTIRWPNASEAAILEAGRMARPLGARHHLLELSDLDPAEMLARWLAAADAPCVDGFESAVIDHALARGGVERIATPTGGAALFGLGEPFATIGRARRPLLDRSRPPRTPPDPFDLGAQRDVERTALRRVPVHAAQTALSLLPASTRDVLVTTGARPPDGTARVGGPPLVAIAAAAMRATIDRELRAPSSRTWRPFLDPSVVAAALRLSPRVRFGRPGSGGPLARWLRRAHGWADPKPVEGFEPTLNAWLRGPLAPWFGRALAPERLAAQGVWKPDGVARAVALWREGAPGWTARVVFALALAAAWLDRDGLSATRP